jgi:hypothetical protein
MSKSPLAKITFQILKTFVFAFCVFWMFILIFVRVVGYDRAVTIVSEITGFSTDELIADSTEHSNTTIDAIQTQAYTLFFWASIVSATFGALVLSQGRTLFEVVVLFVAFAIPKQRRHWGRVHDAVTGKDLAFVTVRLYDKLTDKFLSQTITDLDGQYRLHIPDRTRQYRVEALADGYKVFNLDIAANSAETLDKELIVNIPLTPSESTHQATLKVFWEKFRSRIYPFTLVYMYFFNIAGILMAVYGMVANPSPTDYISFILYFCAFIWNNSVMFDRLKLGVGKFYEADSKHPVTGVQVNIFDQNKQILSVNTLSQSFTKFDLPAGTYKAEISKPGFKLSQAETNLTEIKIRDDGYLAQNVYLQKTSEAPQTSTLTSQIANPFA